MPCVHWVRSNAPRRGCIRRNCRAPCFLESESEARGKVRCVGGAGLQRVRSEIDRSPQLPRFQPRLHAVHLLHQTARRATGDARAVCAAEVGSLGIVLPNDTAAVICLSNSRRPDSGAGRLPAWPLLTSMWSVYGADTAGYGSRPRRRSATAMQTPHKSIFQIPSI